MKRLLKSPIFNAACIGLFTAFYSLAYLLTLANTDSRWQYEGSSSFWNAWSKFLIAGGQIYVVAVLVAVTIVVIVLLLVRRRSLDEFHYAILKYCLIISLLIILTLLAFFFLIALIEPAWVFGKFMLFIMIQWITVVIANLIHIILIHRK